jgi:hypothetical protein
MAVGPKIFGYLERSPERAAPADAPGSFRPIPAQWASLKLASVQSLTFHAKQVTDGRIAICDDRTTPVFSPAPGTERLTGVAALLLEPVTASQVHQPAEPKRAVEKEAAQGDIGTVEFA